MTTCVFFEAGTERLLTQLRLDAVPAVGDTIVLPAEVLPRLVEHRTWRPTVDVAPRVTREVVELWVSVAT